MSGSQTNGKLKTRKEGQVEIQKGYEERVKSKLEKGKKRVKIENEKREEVKFRKGKEGQMEIQEK